jgi:hypothetical protein
MRQEDQDQAFVPKGSIAFFTIMICFYVLLWLFFYFLMINRL